MLVHLRGDLRKPDGACSIGSDAWSYWRSPWFAQVHRRGACIARPARRGGSQRLDTRALDCLICQRQCVGLNRVSNPAWEVTGAVLSYRRSRRGGACSPLGIQSCWLSGALGGVEKQVGRSKAIGSHLVQHLQDGYTLLQSQTVFNVGRLLVVCCLAFFPFGIALRPSSPLGRVCGVQGSSAQRALPAA